MNPPDKEYPATRLGRVELLLDAMPNLRFAPFGVPEAALSAKQATTDLQAGQPLILLGRYAAPGVPNQIVTAALIRLEPWATVDDLTNALEQAVRAVADAAERRAKEAGSGMGPVPIPWDE